MSPSLLAAAVFTALSPMAPPPNPPVEVVVIDYDTLLVQSRYPIKSAFLANHYERYSFFVDYSPDGCKARILLRTRKPSLRVVVELGNSDSGPVFRHEIVTKNPRGR